MMILRAYVLSREEVFKVKVRTGRRAYSLRADELVLVDSANNVIAITPRAVRRMWEIIIPVLAVESDFEERTTMGRTEHLMVLRALTFTNVLSFVAQTLKK
jgi:hypothetical protein